MPYKFLCCTDTHLLCPPKLDETGATAWLHGGDVYNQGHSAKGQKASPLSIKLHAWIESRTIPVFAVKGNHDCSFDVPFFDKADHVSGCCRRIGPGLILVGIGWTGGVFYDLPVERDIQKVCDSIRRELNLKTTQHDKYVFLTHYPPWCPTLYDNAGRPEGWMFDSIRELMDELKPMAVIQGHIHGLFGAQLIYHGADFDTLIVSPGPCGGVLTIDPEASTATFGSAGIDPRFFQPEPDLGDTDEDEKNDEVTE